NVEQTLVSLAREFLLDLSTGFVYDVLHDHAAGLDLAAHRRKVLKHFSGTLCVDELHLGRFTLLLATDPISDLPVAFALVDANDQPHMRRFLKNLKRWGLTPRVVVTDGSNLYPALLAELWSEAAHQLCVFHVIQDINKLVLDAVRRLRNAMKRRGQAGRKKKRGRKGATAVYRRVAHGAPNDSNTMDALERLAMAHPPPCPPPQGGRGPYLPPPLWGRAGWGVESFG